MDWITPVRWALTPVATLAGFAVSLVLLALAGSLVAQMPADFDARALLPLDFRVACVGAMVAFATVLAGSRTAPSARPVVSLLIFAAGSWAAWFLLRYWYFPEPHPRAYQVSLVPLIGTEVGGLVGVAVIWKEVRRRTLQSARSSAPRPEDESW